MASLMAGTARDLQQVRVPRRYAAPAGTTVLLTVLGLAPPASAAPKTTMGVAVPDHLLVAKDQPSPEEVFSYDALCVRADALHGWRPCRGRDQDALSYQDFFRVAGRPDLAEADEKRWWRRQLLIGAGAAAAVIGVASLAPRLFGKSIAPVWLSAAVIAGGSAFVIWGVQVSQEPLVGPGQAADIARSYNQELREQLGLPPLDGRRLAIGIGYQRVF